MRKVITCSIMFILSACAPYRQGSVIVNQFSTAGHRTSDQLDIKDEETMLIVKDKLSIQMMNDIKNLSEMKITDRCDPMSYVLEGKIPVAYSVVIRGHRYYNLSAEGTLKDCKTGEEVIRFHTKSGECESLNAAVYYLSGSILHKISKY